MNTCLTLIDRQHWLTLAALLAATLSVGWSHATRADVVTDWGATAQTAIVTNAGRPPSGSIVDVTYVYDVVPEPTSLLLLSCGLVAAGWRRRRQA